jgi:hypothetical protein
MCSAVWGRKHEIGDGLIVLAQILVGEAPTVIGARLLGAGVGEDRSPVTYFLKRITMAGRNYLDITVSNNVS